MSKRILVIDDNETIRKSFSLALEDTEYQVDIAESGEKGIEKEQEGKYDLIFLDLKMPGFNGVETLREIRKIDPDVPIYIVTAFYNTFSVQLVSARDDGLSFEVLQKPIDRDQVLTVTKEVLEGPA